MDTKYIGEHLLPGQIGHFSAVLAFVAAILASISYFMAVQSKDDVLKNSWKKLARWAFIIQALAVFTTFGSLYYALYNHYFEYKYVWRNSSRDLPVSYLLSSFWADQEGSFLLWSIWHSVLGLLLIRFGKKWEAPVMATLSFAQIFLGSMLIGIYILDYRVGSNPFLLLRLAEENQGLPWVANANYLDFIKDGNGLNLSLQNYWMVIHPPVLFLGFASTIIPFAYAFAGLWTREYKEWIKPALPWSLFSAMILGTGIMMGAAWAYESLTFGGYWAWDPVENASLVPWLTLVAGIHTLLAFKFSGHALKPTFFFFFITFVLILYSTFLTRSGVLGDTSVHSFTDLGMSGQLLVYMAVFVIPAFALLIIRSKEIPDVAKEASTYSREFWLFVGALILMIAAIQITFTTSIPVWNKIINGLGLKKLFGLEQDIAPPSDGVFHYNKIQIFVAIVLGILTAIVQYLKYKDTPKGHFIKKIGIPTVISLVITGLIGIFGNITYDAYGGGFLGAIYVMLFTSVYAIVANAMFIIVGQKGKLRVAGGSVAHVGFGMVLLGILISSSKKEVISIDRMKMLDGGFFGKESKENPRENLMLPKNFPVQMGDYHVTYAGDSLAEGDAKTYYLVRYERRDPSNGNILEKFTLHPDAFLSNKGQQQLTPNPDSKHYFTKDIFTYITAVPIKDASSDTAQYNNHDIAPGDSVFFANGYIILEGIQPQPQNRNYTPQPNDLAVGAQLRVVTKNNEQYNLMPVYSLRDSSYEVIVPDTVAPLSLYVKFSKVLPKEKKIQIQVKESDTFKDYIVMKAFIFPYINVLWLGILVMVVGFVMSIVQRVKANKSKSIQS
ncbi:cytochrome c biogenesis protein CcsA [Chitinophaga pinensis]|uniref:Cytochrome c assembly protein n=1 Tax=Chitinophaga pinensis (strain ATCC 43595 / DSM 2588 / LMG 13176 / NBRC 15968 / NCIMB 11800 / UQM 2034) TaxID=485918 RepID=A0A979GPH7_CHIPD|nr:cytochrome c biogenesis protein CcsA [Chitinophaga pinensis]ACU60547.1 cytochrome c assembly protein [Chitinophaga pinensis DSM 2588]